MIFVDGTDEILYSEDGCTQGDPIAMLLYGVGAPGRAWTPCLLCWPAAEAQGGGGGGAQG